MAIYAPHATPLYEAQGDLVSTGGAEAQAFTLARELARRGLNVCHVVFGNGDLPQSVEGIDLVPLPPDIGTRNIASHTAAIVRALTAASARVYVQRSAGYDTGVVATFAAARRRRFLFSASSMADVSSRPSLVPGRETVAYRLGIRLASDVIVQTSEQAQALQLNYGRRGQLIRSFCAAAPAASNRERAGFLWIGGLIDYKDPLSYLELAERVPDAQFWMIGTARGAEWTPLASAVKARAAKLANFQFLAPRPRSELFALYERAVAVVNTSTFEGFPNTFLEGWARGAPALSLNIDPDSVIARNGIGICAEGSFERFVEAAERLWHGRGTTNSISTACREYIAASHDPAVVTRDWERVIREVQRDE